MEVLSLLDNIFGILGGTDSCFVEIGAGGCSNYWAYWSAFDFYWAAWNPGHWL